MPFEANKCIPQTHDRIFIHLKNTLECDRRTERRTDGPWLLQHSALRATRCAVSLLIKKSTAAAAHHATDDLSTLQMPLGCYAHIHTATQRTATAVE